MKKPFKKQSSPTTSRNGDFAFLCSTVCPKEAFSQSLSRSGTRQTESLSAETLDLVPRRSVESPATTSITRILFDGGSATRPLLDRRSSRGKAKSEFGVLVGLFLFKVKTVSQPKTAFFISRRKNGPTTTQNCDFAFSPFDRLFSPSSVHGHT